MRIGTNPNKDQKIKNNYYHRIIVPVCVPHLEGYFKDGLKITALCLESLIKTIHNQSALTVINNGSCTEVTNYLQKLYISGKLDQLIHHKENLGKIDAVIPVAKTSEEPLITITDGDVLFKKNWIHAVEDVFNYFPEAGMVSPVPHGTVYGNYTANTLFDGALKNMLTFQQLNLAQEMLLFAKSIGKEKSMYKKQIRLQYQLTVKRKNQSAVVGCGHFVSTLRKEVFDFSPNKKSRLAYSSDADRYYIDIPVEKAKLWRLATVKNYAYHMGNCIENWMVEIVETEQTNTVTPTYNFGKSKKIQLPYKLKALIINKLVLNKIVKPKLFKIWGLKQGYYEY
ncbi:glycosyltransferase family A protein [uncultured Lutibacter sp.]|uniref:glycosyltransferase family A protein n=1 Tax=uncultured Lutibacter sp. TaxID=437739 RepID=UPI002628D583|nr:glycosyltransferase family A protein [uncultured Lutibacter sp.]